MVTPITSDHWSFRLIPHEVLFQNMIDKVYHMAPWEMIDQLGFHIIDIGQPIEMRLYGIKEDDLCMHVDEFLGDNFRQSRIIQVYHYPASYEKPIKDMERDLLEARTIVKGLKIARAIQSGLPYEDVNNIKIEAYTELKNEGKIKAIG